MKTPENYPHSQNSYPIMTRFINIVIKLLSILFFLFYANRNYAQEKIITKNISTTNPENLCISIKNNSDSLLRFSFSLNNKFYTSLRDINDKIYAMSNQNKDSLFYYAWKFVCNSSYSYASLTKRNWITSPILYINSLGFGLCGKQAVFLENIWKNLGYETRIWGLNDHIVPEVFYKKSWHMLDPAFRVYFLNDSNEIAGVKELNDKPTLITNPKVKLKNDVYYFLRYSKAYKNFITSLDADKISYKDFVTEDITDFKIVLPPTLTFEFPGIFSKKVKTLENTSVPYYANCRIKIPPAWTGTVYNTLILCDIIGNGKIRIDNIEYMVNDSNLTKIISSYYTFIDEISIGEHTDTIELIYLMNPAFSEIHSENSLIIKGTNIGNLQINNFNLPDSLSMANRLKKQYFFYENSRINLLSSTLNSNIPCIKNSNINSKDNFIEYLTKYYGCIKAGDKNEIKTITNKIQNCFNQLPENYNFDKLFFIINNLPKEILFDDFKNASEEDIFSILSFINKKE